MDKTLVSPLVSIIMPTYNRAGLIMETIESIRSQTYTNWELIIMDDGSDDNTEDIVSQLNDDRIVFIKEERTGMVSKLKNMAIHRSRAELIAFMDSDDLWASTKLEKQVAALGQYPEAGFCLTGGYTFVKKGEPVQYLYNQRSGLLFDNIFIALFRSEISAWIPVLLCRKKCIDVAGLFDEIKPFSDPDFIVSLASHFSAVVLFEPLLFRRLHDKNDSDEHWEKRYHEWIDIIRSYQSKKRLPQVVARQVFFKLYINLGEACLQHKKRKKAILHFLRAWSKKPFSIVPLKKMGKAMLRG